MYSTFSRPTRRRRHSKDNQSLSFDWSILQKCGLFTKKEDSLLAVTASSFAELKSFQCSRRPVGLDKVPYDKRYTVIALKVELEVWRALTGKVASRPTGKARPGRDAFPRKVRTSAPDASPHFCCTKTASMVRGVEGNEMSTPRPSQKKQPTSGSQSAKNQKSILGFFQKKSTNSPSPAPSQPTPAKQTPTSTFSKKSFTRPPPSLTPVPSSDAIEPSSPIRQEEEDTPVAGRNKENGLLLRTTTPDAETDRVVSEVAGVALSSPSRKVCKQSI